MKLFFVIKIMLLLCVLHIGKHHIPIVSAKKYYNSGWCGDFDISPAIVKYLKMVFHKF